MRLITWLIPVLLLTTCSREPGFEETARHVILISMDTARADHFGFLGNQRAATPRLDELADESIVFTDCMTVVPTTLPSHTSLFTGKHPHHHGVARNGFTVNQTNQMLPELLKRAGFLSVGFAGSFALDGVFGFDQGFDHYDQDFDRLADVESWEQNERSATAVTDAVLRYLDEAGVPDRLFLFVHYFDPHHPYAAPDSYEVAYDPLGDSGLPPVSALRGNSTFSPREKVRYGTRHTRHYAAEISYMDDQLGRLLDELRRREVLEDALLLVTSDHGETFWEHDEKFNHGHRVYQTTIHAVCMLRLPRAARGGSRVDGLTANIDILPTLLAFLGIPIPSEVDGQAIDLRSGSGLDSERKQFGQASKPWEDIETDARWANLSKSRFVRSGPYKFIQTPYRGSEELYDLARDPWERHNLLTEPSQEILDIANELRKDLESWAATADPLPSQFDPSQTQETMDRLRALGYFE